MIHIADIEQSLAEDDIREIEGAFRALVDFPKEEEIEGAESVETLVDLLGRVCAALEHDQATAPASTCRVIAGNMQEPTISDGAPYALCAQIVARHRDRWRALYLIHAMDESVPK